MAFQWSIAREIPVLNERAKIADHPIHIIVFRDATADDMIGAAIRAVLTENAGHVACSYNKCLRVVPSECPVVIINSRLYHESCYSDWYRDLNSKPVRRRSKR